MAQQPSTMLISVQTPAAGGTAYAQFDAQWCQNGNGYLLNDTGTSLDVKIGADASPVAVANGKGIPFKLVFNCNELFVRRTDQATTQVTVEAQVGIEEVPSDSGTGSVAASDITDAGTTGIAVMQAETPAEAQVAIGVNGHNPGIILVGSSTLALEGYQTINGLNAYKSSNHGCVTNGLFLSGAPAQIIANLAIGGSVIAGIQSQFAAAIALNPECIVVQAFSNDAAAGVTAATMYDALHGWITTCIEKKIHLIIRASHYREMSAAYLKEFLKIRELSLAAAIGSRYIHVIDGYGDMVDQSSTTGACKVNYLMENLHPTNLAAYYNGKSFAELFRKIFQPAPENIPDSYDVNGAGVQYLFNPAFSASGGTCTTPVTGSAPQYWTVSVPTIASRSDGLTTSVVSSIVTDSEGYPAIRLEVSNAIAGDEIRISHPNAAGGLTLPLGDYETGCVVRYESGAVFSQPSWETYPMQMFIPNATASNNYPLSEQGIKWTIKFKYQITASGRVSAYLHLYARNATAGNAVVTFRSPYVRKIGTT